MQAMVVRQPKQPLVAEAQAAFERMMSGDARFRVVLDVVRD
jgi:hypothetical protein